MTSRLFHSIIVGGAALAALPAACASEPLSFDDAGAGSGELDAGAPKERCRAEDGGCVEHCAPIADGGCLDPCFVHTTECSPDCVAPDGGCGWPPTK